MPSDDTQPADRGASGDHRHDPVTRTDTAPDAEPARHDAPAKTSKYNLGRPHSSRAQSPEERIAERMSEEQTEQFLRTFRDVIAPQLLRTADTVRSTLDAAGGLRSMAAALAEVFATAELVRDAWSHQILTVLAPALHDLPSKIMRATGPPTWKNLTDDELKAVIVTATAGIPVTWIPRTAILRELLAADPADQLTVLSTHSTAITEDCATSVNQTRSGTFMVLATYTEDAIRAYQAGHTAASQALSASLIDTLLRTIFFKSTSKHFQYREVRDKITAQPALFPEAIACLPVAHALATFHGHSQVPASFNRHASAHAVGAEQYTPANALVSLMLAASLLRQAHHSAHEASSEENGLA